MSTRIKRLTNLYYATEPLNNDPDLVWDSDDSLMRLKIANSPRFQKWCQKMSEYKYDEEWYEKWKNITSKSDELREEIQTVCKWKVRMFESVVYYIYKPRINGVRIEGYKFRIKFEYVGPVRKWFLRLGGSFIPDVIIASLDLSSFEAGISSPTSKRVVTFMSTIRRLIDAYMVRQQYVNEFLKNVERNYPDLNVKFDKELKTITLVYKAGRDDVWITDHPKTSRRDSITLQMKLDNSFVAIPDVGIECDYRVSRKVSPSEQQQLYRSLLTRIRVFTQRPLKEAFEELMNELMSE